MWCHALKIFTEIAKPLHSSYTAKNRHFINNQISLMRKSHHPNRSHASELRCLDAPAQPINGGIAPGIAPMSVQTGDFRLSGV
jgi:hypothetical protein